MTYLLTHKVEKAHRILFIQGTQGSITDNMVFPKDMTAVKVRAVEAEQP